MFGPLVEFVPVGLRTQYKLFYSIPTDPTNWMQRLAKLFSQWLTVTLTRYIQYWYRVSLDTATIIAIQPRGIAST